MGKGYRKIPKPATSRSWKQDFAFEVCKAGFRQPFPVLALRVSLALIVDGVTKIPLLAEVKAR